MASVNMTNDIGHRPMTNATETLKLRSPRMRCCAARAMHHAARRAEEEDEEKKFICHVNGRRPEEAYAHLAGRLDTNNIHRESTLRNNCHIEELQQHKIQYED